MMISFLVFLFALFLVLGAYLLATHGSDAKRARLQKRLSEALLHSAHTEDVEVVLARNELLSEIPALNRTLVSMQAALQSEEDVGPGRPAYHAVAPRDVFRHGRNARGDGLVGSQRINPPDVRRRTPGRGVAVRPRLVETQRSASISFSNICRMRSI